MYLLFNLVEINKKQITSSVEDIDSFFLRLSVKDIPTYENKILANINTYFEKGHFIAFNNSFTRFLKHLKGLSDTEMHKFVIRYTISSIIENNWDNFSNDIYSIRQNYTQFDMNIYLL